MKTVILGAGIAGLSLARALQVRGCNPLIIAHGHRATAAGAGIVSSQFWQVDLYKHALRSQEIIATLVPANRCGMVQIALTPECASHLEQIPGNPKIVPDELHKLFRNEFTNRIVSADYCKSDFWVDNNLLLNALSAGLQIKRQQATAISYGTVHCGDDKITYDKLVIACGASNIFNRVFKNVGSSTCRKSELASINFLIPTAFHVMETGIYMRPDGNSSLVGDGDSPFDQAAEPASFCDVSQLFLKHAYDQCIELFGDEDFGIRPSSAGIIRFTENGQPIIMRDKNIWIFTGFGADGLALAPSMAESLAIELLN